MCILTYVPFYHIFFYTTVKILHKYFTGLKINQRSKFFQKGNIYGVLMIEIEKIMETVMILHKCRYNGY